MEIVTWLPLKSLIAARGLDHRWRHLTSLASILRARRLLLDLYLQAIANAQVVDTIESIRPHLRPFDRPSYVALLEHKNGGVALPEEFRVWLLEWPSAVIGWAWPGLDIRSLDAAMPTVVDTYGSSPLSHLYVSVEDVVIFENIKDAGEENSRCEKVQMKALEIYKCRFWSYWLVLGGPRQGLLGTVHAITAHQAMLEGTSLANVIREMERFKCPGWTHWLSKQVVNGQW
ncbi:hypothetical protein FIBSPDRAFT_875427 [Athelia psychrophila]|uniref:F-box domain-containing protein n=1 Tax=Athelia psychrophila TaxID=1759441 RepID=A0A167XRT8_9AGAM|nr:hypothetical protein FIBSPDRAFT_875427 [Fibularhizoctonia sp. CBS 109695]